MTKTHFQTGPVTIPIHGSDETVAVRRIYCVGRNYVAHIREMAEGDEKDPPFFFQKPTDSIVTGGEMPYPAATADLQFEVELAVIIGTEGADISPGAAFDHVFGYAVALDMTRRDLQFLARDMRRPWEMGKSFDHSAPIGAVLPRAEAGDLTEGTIRISVNGEVKQDSDISLMIWGVADTIAHLSAQYRLMPGDVILTGTPAGVGPVVPGDVLDASCAGLPGLTLTVTPALTAKEKAHAAD
ncbi:5-carboxymethyl-2-hydroxymuconate isomerase [Primorskyibacter flagellatus]|uniref:5-carboxymethyl-2-hydroxymuconate isomerase n=1 Tax=Primorskyibacter flagellatus TaxID=1387277 RepID=A0A916ZWP4_9RHOB|nr:fumarylacetoacetate hydrolase family protein [Primorskyibacter flagellatus]GGE16218.1 5-carboxymethyl-2-hydroxymuconate isomerase [Primorskyibacter flagellatus]